MFFPQTLNFIVAYSHEYLTLWKNTFIDFKLRFQGL